MGPEVFVRDLCTGSGLSLTMAQRIFQRSPLMASRSTGYSDSPNNTASPGFSVLVLYSRSTYDVWATRSFSFEPSLCIKPSGVGDGLGSGCLGEQR